MLLLAAPVVIHHVVELLVLGLVVVQSQGGEEQDLARRSDRLAATWCAAVKLVVTSLAAFVAGACTESCVRGVGCCAVVAQATGRRERVDES